MNSPPPDLPDWAAVARDYLGPRVADALQQTPPADRPAAFAQAWCQLEARLKCAGLGLAEWHPARDQRLAACQLWPLQLPIGGWGALALGSV
jgi:4'-phosphopantetheinyl transferase